MTPVARALLIGVGRTSFAGRRFPDLPGVARDIANVESMLTNRGFAVDAPTDPSRLSADAVAQSLVRAIDATEAGDLTVLYFSGHGFRYPDSSGDEVDDWDEAFVCADRPIPDDWFREELWPRAKDGARIAAIVDACHSETAVRGILPGPRVTVPPTKAATVSGYYRLILSACRDFETTIEIGPTDSGGGVVTREMLRVLTGDVPTYRALWDAVGTGVGTNYSNRKLGVPRLESLGPDDSFVNSAPFTVR